MGIRNFLDDKVAPHFEKGGKYNRFYVFYEMFDTMFFSPESKTGGRTHVRDGLDLKRIMITVWLAAWPAMLFGVWNVGFQANTQIADFGLMPIEGWRSDLVLALVGFDPNSFLSNFIHGLAYYLPIFVVVYLSGFLWEGLFAFVRGHEVNEGFFVTGMLFTLILPPTIPLWMVFLGVSFGVVVGKEVFGGTGKNFLNPALVGRAFLYFAYPAYMSGDAIWTAADNFTGATLLSVAQQGGVAALEAADSLQNAAFGFVQGSIGEVSTVAIFIGMVFLLITKIASWRIILGTFLGMVVTSLILNVIGSDTNPLFSVPWYWHLVIGGFAFGMVYMATDPVSAAHTNSGRFIYGLLIGFMAVLIRVINPAFPEGIMLAILFGNLFAPLIDYFVVQANVKRRLARG